jgi:transposase
MEAYAGINLHSSNNFIAVIYDRDQRVKGKRVPNRLNTVLSALEPFRES